MNGFYVGCSAVANAVSPACGRTIQFGPFDIALEIENITETEG